MIGAATFAARARTGGAALSRPYTTANSDLATGPSPKVSLTTFTQTTTNAQFAMGSSESGQSYYIGNNLSGKYIRYANTNPGEPNSGVVQAYRIGIYPTGVSSIIDCDSDIGFYNQSTNSAAQAQIIRSRCVTDINAQRGDTGSGGAIDLGGLVRDCDVSNTSVDGIWAGYNNRTSFTPGAWSVVENCRAVGAAFNYYGGHLYGGTLPYDGATNPADAPGGANAVSTVEPNKAMILASTPLTAGMQVTIGELITTPLGTLGSGMYQIVGPAPTPATGYSAGPPYYVGTENPSGNWPDTSSDKWDSITASQQSTPPSPFTTGNVLAILIGGAFHSDSSQTNDRQRVRFSHGFFADFANSCSLCQNSSGNTNALPVMNWVYEDMVFRGGGYYDLYVQTQTGDNVSTLQSGFTPSSKKAGGFVRNSDATWSISPSNPGHGDSTNLLGNSRPWHVSLRRNSHLQATSPLSPRGSSIPTFGQALSSDGAIVVASEQIRDAGIALQFGWDPTDQRLAQMRDGLYDYNSMPAPVSSVLEARYQALCSNTHLQTNQSISVSPGAMDARTWIVLEPTCVGRATMSSTATPLYPHLSSAVPIPANQVDSNGHPLTDANGYYIGQ